MSAHAGRCFRAARRTRLRKERQGKTWTIPIRWKVPQAIAPFLTGNSNQLRARFDQMALAISRYAEHQRKTGKGGPVRAAAE